MELLHKLIRNFFFIQTIFLIQDSLNLTIEKLKQEFEREKDELKDSYEEKLKQKIGNEKKSLFSYQ